MDWITFLNVMIEDEKAAISKYAIAAAKADSEELKAVLELGHKMDESIPVVKTVATEGTGTEQLMRTISRLILKKSRHQQEARKKRLIEWMLKDIISENIYKEVTQKVHDSEWKDCIEKIFHREVDPYTVAEELMREMKGD